jgi:N-acetylglucosamine-6-phosphate deacetylase
MRLGVSAALVDGVLVSGDVAVADGVIEAVGLPGASGGDIAAPGFVDLQVNGFAGVDLMATSVLYTLPVALVFVIARKHLMTARTAGAVKG